MKLKKFTIYLLLLPLALSLFFAIGCSENGGDDIKGIKVIFELEGGTYQNSKLPVEYYFQVGDKEDTLIVDPTGIISSEGVRNQGYVLEGWYKTKTGDGDGATYSDKWNFATDKASASSTLTLYAHWVKKVSYTFSVCYKEGDEVKVLGSYNAVEGSTFDDRNRYAEKRNGYTALGDKDNAVLYYDENGNLWDKDFKHPGGEVDLDVKVFVNFVKGVFTFIYDKDDLLDAPSNRGIYLMNDIDMEGEALSFSNFSRKEFFGNNHKVSNFTIKYDEKNQNLIDLKDPVDGTIIASKTLCVSLFSNLDRSTIKDVSFENASVNLTAQNSFIAAIYLAPLAVRAVDTTISNVSFIGTYTVGNVTKTPTIATDLIYLTDTETQINDSTCSFIQAQNG